MSHLERLRTRLNNSPYLTADTITGDVALVDQATAFDEMTNTAPFPHKVVLDLARALEGFARLGNDPDGEFSMKDMAAAAGISYHLAYNYIRRGIFTASIRPFGGSGRGQDCEALFSWRDCFIAATVGCLRRHGLKPDVLQHVPKLFEEKRPKRKGRTSTRA